MRVLHVGFGFRPWRAGGLIAYAEDLMEGQARRGHDVAYFFCGRRYPLPGGTHMHRWRRRGVHMLEVLNPPEWFAGAAGTPVPELDLSVPELERRFRSELRRFAPDVVHVQELAGLPSSLLDIARAEGVRTVMTLEDYFPLCPTLQLWDSDGRVCVRTEPGPQCARCSAKGPSPAEFVERRTLGMSELTLVFEMQRFRRFLPSERAIAAARRVVLAWLRRGDDPVRPGAEAPLTELTRDCPPGDEPTAARYQRRRDVNVQRLSQVDALVAMSHRVAELYTTLGVSPERMEIQQLTLAHLESLPPTLRRVAPGGPLRIATLNGAASVQKGARVLVGALEILREQGRSAEFVLDVFGYAAPNAERLLSGVSNVTLHGGYVDAELPALLVRCHVGLVPSVWEEPYGYVGPEFLALGMPVIGNARGGIVDYARPGETGWLNEDASPAGLAAVIAGILDAPGEVERLSERVVRERTSIIKPLERHLDETDELYARLVS